MAKMLKWKDWSGGESNLFFANVQIAHIRRYAPYAYEAEVVFYHIVKSSFDSSEEAKEWCEHVILDYMQKAIEEIDEGVQSKHVCED
jgi:hypothetical protein